MVRIGAMNLLGNGLDAACHYEDALSVRGAELSMLRRLGRSEGVILAAQSNLAGTYQAVGRFEDALGIYRDAQLDFARLYGEEHQNTLRQANRYALCLLNLRRFAEAKSLLRRTLPVARRVLGEDNEVTVKMRAVYAGALFRDDDATLDDLLEAVTTLEDVTRIARRVFGGANPVTVNIEEELRDARAALAAREAKG